MMHRRDTAGERVTINIDGKDVEAAVGESVAAAVLAASADATRTTPVSGAPRAPYCMMGVCFECLMDIDGIPNRQACMVSVEPGMKIKRQAGARAVGDAP